ncbi:60S ribosomal export protein NMD3-like [Sinocyclocheilus anshuiensis]|uniref:60S ribosomal export protein NMD3-like n=1 Tax=Sinocyclocheilus anshuiensis TaxID=1608454 RepID=UPI0007BA1DA1|nr:PREDICTED: 60S ribosomal export protein NMD3-like [Sinocyclocheilus anshuiensis]
MGHLTKVSVCSCLNEGYLCVCRYLQPLGTWLQCALESHELLALCLKKLKASVAKVRLIDAGFLWTEPHSKRIKMKLTIQKEVMNGAILQQVFVVEFVIQPQMCEDCHRVEAKDFWKAVVQVRQKLLRWMGARSGVIRSAVCVARGSWRSSSSWTSTLSEISVFFMQLFIQSPVIEIETVHEMCQDKWICFDFTNANINDEFLNKMNPHHVPDVVRQSRITSLQLMCIQYTEFLEDLEEDEMLRKNVNIFRDASKIPVVSETDDDGAPRISLAEMEDLSLSDATGGAGAHMMTD